MRHKCCTLVLNWAYKTCRIVNLAWERQLGINFLFEEKNSKVTNVVELMHRFYGIAIEVF